MFKGWIKRVPAMALALAIAGFSIPSYAAWKPLGPYGGSAESIVVAPDNANLLVSAAKNGLIYRSLDAGEHWSPVRFAPALSLSSACDESHRRSDARLLSGWCA